MTGLTRDLESPIRKRTSAPFSRRDFLAGAGAFAAGLTIDAGLIARHTYELTTHRLKIAKLPEAFHGYGVVQLSDVHLEEFTEPLFLQLIVHRINELAPDLVLLTGDFASFGPLSMEVSRNAILRCAEILKGIKCPLRYAVLGNHDTTIGAQFVVDAFTAVGIPVLVNQHVPIERNGQRFWLGGLDDPGTAHPVLDLAVPKNPDGPVILMCHPPDYADEVIRHPRGSLVDVMLSGHTHGGQVRLPFLGPMVLPPMGQKYVAGFFRFNQMQLYVTRGIGTVGLPVRFNCPPEVTHFTLEPA